jgi:NADPH:quinone reductase-like Zn-dependent oxidoreductase
VTPKQGDHPEGVRHPFYQTKEVVAMASPVVSNEMYVILGASGNTGSIIANFLLSKGEKVRVVGRDAGRLQRFVVKGAEAFTADMRLRSPNP